ncbi:MAG: ABC transporter substrate-binding protein [Streptosporangiaceae bacterium]|nr:ABC transporter substrate-binding protein [Streptosporangiaceae bacterium]MBV9858299.1 ABC transporter substrate-binding protein [Streptosporangiaceae bacterium]
MAKHRLRAALAGSLAVAAVVALGAAACGTDASSGAGGSTIQVWEGYTQVEARVFAHLVAEYEAQHPGQHVSILFVNNDNSLQKVLTAVRGGSPPDVAYLYGSWAPNVAQIPQVVNLTTVVRQPGVNWDDFWVGERDVATVNGKVIGVPALVDNLAVVYNKTLFARAGLRPPGPGWTWQQFQADAQKLTNPAIKQYGTAYVTPGNEDTVWHWEALLWEAGGQLLTADGKRAAFDSPAGLASLNTLRAMAVTDRSMYLDPTDSAYDNLFNSGKIGMLVTGPWDLATFPNVHYGVQIMPSYPGTGGGHQTISGPDNWVVFNNGGASVAAAEKFILWLTAPAQVRYFSMQTGDLPIRQSVGDVSGFGQQMDRTLPGVSTFITNLANVRQARPQIPQYPKISQVLASMIVSVLLGKSQPRSALDSAAQQVNQVLAAS